jgi:hypothetical protein
MSTTRSFLSMRSLARRRARRLGLALSVGIVGALAAPAASLANHAPEACTANAVNGIGCLTVSDTPDPAQHGSPVTYRAVVTNRSKSAGLTKVSLTEALPADCVSASSTVGSASCSGKTATATIGKLAKGATATVTVKVTAPSGDSSSADSSITNVATLSFADNNPNDPGKTATTTYTETTGVNNPQYCREAEGNCTGQTASADGLQDANALIPTPTTDVLLSMSVLPPDSYCLFGQVTIAGSVYVCRSGGWFDISVTDVSTGSPYVVTSGDPMVFTLRWKASRVSGLQTKSNFVVFKETAGGSIDVIGNTAAERCASEGGTGTALPRICNITRDAFGSWSVDLITDRNGRMR